MINQQGLYVHENPADGKRTYFLVRMMGPGGPSMARSSDAPEGLYTELDPEIESRLKPVTPHVLIGHARLLNEETERYLALLNECVFMQEEEIGLLRDRKARETGDRDRADPTAGS